jgi:predicted ATP-grasp superfamily ATP-dependent carboligase
VTHDRVRVLLTGGEFIGGLAAVRALRAAGFEPWVAVTRSGAYASRSRAAAGTVAVPDAALDPDGFVTALAEAARSLSAAVVLPGTERGLVALAGREDAFPVGTALGTCPPEAVQKAIEKPLLEQLAASAGLQTPPSTTLSLADVNGREREVRYPAVVKPLQSELPDLDGSLRHFGARRVEGPAELRAALGILPAQGWLVQPYLVGRLWAVCGVSWRGELVCAAHQVSERIWPPGCGGSAYAITVSADAELERAVGRLLGLIGWSGLFQAQFIRKERAFLIDLNPRIYGSLSLAVAAGLNLPAIWTDLLLGRRPEVGRYRAGVRYRAEENDVRALGSALLSGRLRFVLHGLLPRRGTVHAIVALRDPGPALTSLAKLAAKLSLRRAHARSWQA